MVERKQCPVFRAARCMQCYTKQFQFDVVWEWVLGLMTGGFRPMVLQRRKLSLLASYGFKELHSHRSVGTKAAFDGTSAYAVRRFVEYCGAWRTKTLRTNKHSLWSTHCVIGCQWRSRRAVITWSRGCSWNMSRAVAWMSLWSDTNVYAGSPAST
jgi:hypothetical protein